MKSAPYPHPSRDKGYVYNKVLIPREPHYSDSTVGLFIPRGYRRTPKVKVLVYLHGWSNNVRKAISEYKLREQIAASGQNIILIFPEGPRDATDSGCGKLEDQDGLKHRVVESLATLHAAGKIDRAKIGHMLTAGLTWNTSQLYTAVVLSVGLPGDYNQNGIVDAADYVVWRKGLGTLYTQNDYDVWRVHFGQTAGSGVGASANAAAPEPANLELLVLADVGIQLRRRRIE